MTTLVPGSLVYTLTGHTVGLTSLATLPNGNLASGSYDKTIKIWNPNTGSLVYMWQDIHINGNLASDSWDNTVKIWNTNTGSLVFTLTGHKYYINALAALPNGNLASGSYDNTVKIWVA
jgi:WD40 repeat protein